MTGLYELANVADLIVVGTVASVLPAFAASDHANIVWTDSLISVKQVVHGAEPSTTIALTQLGGKAGPCSLIIPDDPLVVRGEEYVLFLKLEKNLLPASTSGFPRYAAFGVWSGKVKVVDGKVRFLPRTNRLLREKFDNTDVNAFLAEITRFVDPLHPKR